jgi:hypothetical protein
LINVDLISVQINLINIVRDNKITIIAILPI